MRRKFLFILICVAVISITGCNSQISKENAVKETELPSYSGASIGYLGPEGTYTQEACKAFFNDEGNCIPYKTVDDSIAALINKENDFAVIPQENTIGGAVIDYVDSVIKNKELYVVGEVELPINQNLLTLKDAQLSDIKTVYSHKQGIAQSKEFLEKELPNAEVIEVSSTAEGAKKVSESKDKSIAAICSAGCADVYGLKVLAEKIQNNDLNKTRFYVLSLEDSTKDEGTRVAFIALGNAQNLPKLMSKIESEGVRLVTVHDRPQKTELGCYNYLIECDDCSYEKYEHIAQTEGFEYRYLGCFNSIQTFLKSND